MKSRRSVVGVVLLLVALGPANPILRADNGPYTVQDVGPGQAVALGLNLNGVVGGAAGVPDAWSAFVTQPGGVPDLLTGLSGSTESVALGVHPDGWAVGYSRVDSYTRAVSFQSGVASDLAPLALLGEAHAVNASGAIAGWAYDNAVKGFIWKNGTATEVPGTTYAQAFAINDAGVVTGTYFNVADFTVRAYRWTGSGAPAVLPTLGGYASEGRGINEQGDVVGTSMNAAFHERAALWRASGALVDLGTFGGATSAAADINNHQQIVGYALNTAGQRRAFLSEDGGPLVDLNTLLEPGSGWVLLRANAINDAGQIAGEGLLNGEMRAFLLTPPADSDTTAPVVGAVVTTPNRIWPPNHLMVDVAVQVNATDDSGEAPVCAVTSIVSSDSANASGDGDTEVDVAIVGPLAVRVRSERSGSSGMRVYTLTVSCTDASGNVGTGTGTVTIGEASGSEESKRKK